MSRRKYWENRAKRLEGHTVGRTDMYSYSAEDGGYVHYAYPPNGERVAFRGSPRSALRKAVKWAERQNAQEVEP